MMTEDAVRMTEDASGMTARDVELIECARAVPDELWYEVDGFIDEAETEEARELLRGIRRWLYRREEFRCGMM